MTTDGDDVDDEGVDDIPHETFFHPGSVVSGASEGTAVGFLGPVACQGIDRPGYMRNVCGDWETATEDDQMQLLQRGIGNRRWGLPIVLAVFEKQ